MIVNQHFAFLCLFGTCLVDRCRSHSRCKWQECRVVIQGFNRWTGKLRFMQTGICTIALYECIFSPLRSQERNRKDKHMQKRLLSVSKCLFLKEMRNNLFFCCLMVFRNQKKGMQPTTTCLRWIQRIHELCQSITKGVLSVWKNNYEACKCISTANNPNKYNLRTRLLDTWCSDNNTGSICIDCFDIPVNVEYSVFQIS